MATYNFHDGVSMQTPPEFLDGIEALDRTRAGLAVYFSGPVWEVRVIAVHRESGPLPNPPTAAQFRAAGSHESSQSRST